MEVGETHRVGRWATAIGLADVVRADGDVNGHRVVGNVGEKVEDVGLGRAVDHLAQEGLLLPAAFGLALEDARLVLTRAGGQREAVDAPARPARQGLHLLVSVAGKQADHFGVGVGRSRRQRECFGIQWKEGGRAGVSVHGVILERAASRQHRRTRQQRARRARPGG